MYVLFKFETIDRNAEKEEDKIGYEGPLTWFKMPEPGIGENLLGLFDRKLLEYMKRSRDSGDYIGVKEAGELPIDEYDEWEEIYGYVLAQIPGFDPTNDPNWAEVRPKMGQWVKRWDEFELDEWRHKGDNDKKLQELTEMLSVRVELYSDDGDY